MRSISSKRKTVWYRESRFEEESIREFPAGSRQVSCLLGVPATTAGVDCDGSRSAGCGYRNGCGFHDAGLLHLPVGCLSHRTTDNSVVRECCQSLQPVALHAHHLHLHRGRSRLFLGCQPCATCQAVHDTCHLACGHNQSHCGGLGLSWLGRLLLALLQEARQGTAGKQSHATHKNQSQNTAEERSCHGCPSFE